MYGRVEVNIHVFLTLKVCRDDESASYTGCFYQWGWGENLMGWHLVFGKERSFCPSLYSTTIRLPSSP